MGDVTFPGDLALRVPGQALIDELLRQWDSGAIRVADGDVTIDDEALGWYLGVLGERQAAAVLSHVGPGWTILHSVPVGTGMTDIDHVAIGPSGVVTINTKYHRGKRIWGAGTNLLVNGSPTRYIGAALWERNQAQRMLSGAVGFDVPVRSAIVFVDPASISAPGPIGGGGNDVDLVRDVDLFWVLDRPRALSDAQVDAIAEAARHPETWHRSPAESSVGTHMLREFAALEAAVATRIDSRRAPLPSTPRHPTAPPHPRDMRPAARRPSTQRPATQRPAASRSQSIWTTPWPSSRPSTRRRRRRGGSIIGEVLVPLAALAIGWMVLQNYLGR